MHRAHADIYTAAIDAQTALFGGCVLRTYTGAFSTTLATQTFGQVPIGTVLSDFIVPTPSHGPAAWSAVAAAYEALITGAWQDAASNAAGNFGCFAIFRGSSINWDGTAGGPGSSKDLVLSAANVTAGAPVSVTEFTIRKLPLV